MTTQHETADTYKPIAEFGRDNRPYAPYYGRGYVKLIRKINNYLELSGAEKSVEPQPEKTVTR
jgi:hypothetical protein